MIVNKLDAARRQFDTAILLWFHEGDPVSILTLAAAGHAIVESLLKKRGLSTKIFDEGRLNPAHRKEYLLAVTKARNFFKHADRDPDAVLDFTVDQGTWFLLDGILSYQLLQKDQSAIATLFLIRCSVEFDGLFAFSDEFRANLPPDILTLDDSRKPFFKKFLPVLAQSLPLRDSGT